MEAREGKYGILDQISETLARLAKVSETSLYIGRIEPLYESSS